MSKGSSAVLVHCILQCFPCIRAALKVMSSTLCWPRTSEVDGGMVVVTFLPILC